MRHILHTCIIRHVPVTQFGLTAVARVDDTVSLALAAFPHEDLPVSGRPLVITLIL